MAASAVAALAPAASLWVRARISAVAEDGCQDRAESVEELREVEAALGGLGWSEEGDVGVRGDLKEGLAAGHDEEAEEECVVDVDVGGGDEEEFAGSADEESEDDAALVAEALDQPAGRPGGEEVSAEESNLDEGRLEVGEVECAAQMGDEDVVEIDADGPEEEEAGDEDEGPEVAAFGDGRVG